MSKNAEIIDVIPTGKAQDQLPKMRNVITPVETEQQYSVTINAGQWMGFLNFTYPTSFTVTTSKAGG